jgi:predicted DCC family thiol-disulfide oxidoreductase YuxK
MTKDTGWIVFYDGTCALCHGFVRFAVLRDRRSVLRFAPLGGETFAASGLASANWSEPPPDSVILYTPENKLLIRSDAALEILYQLGGFWKAAASICGLIPRNYRDFVYDRIAAERKKIFGGTGSVCPIVPGVLRDRFLP